MCLLIWVVWQNHPAWAQYDDRVAQSGAGVKQPASTPERLNTLEQKVLKLDQEQAKVLGVIGIPDLVLLITLIAASGGLFVYFNRRLTKLSSFERKLTDLSSKLDTANKTSLNQAQRVLDLEKTIAGLSHEARLRAQPYQSRKPPVVASEPLASGLPPSYSKQNFADDTAPLNTTPPKTPSQQRTEFYNRVLREIESNTIRKERIVSEWPSMTPMSMNIEMVRLGREVQLSISDNDIFYGLADETGFYEIYLDPGVNVRRIDAVGYAFELEGSGSFIRSIDRPARFKADGRSAMVMVEKGRLSTQ